MPLGCYNNDEFEIQQNLMCLSGVLQIEEQVRLLHLYPGVKSSNKMGI